MTPGELLEGPRGRRLCLELARASIAALPEGHPDVERWQYGLFMAPMRLADDASSSRVIWYSSDADAASTAPPQPYGPGRPGAVSSAIDAFERVPLPDLTAALLLEALVATVDGARYWQPPEGYDALASLPEARGGLLRFAEVIARSPHAQWWSRDDPAAAQYAVIPDDDSEGDPDGDPNAARGDTVAGPPELHLEDVSSRYAGATMGAWRADRRIVEQRSLRDLEEYPGGGSGEWWSFPPHGVLATTGAIPGFGPVALHLEEDGRGPEGATVVPIGAAAHARICTITAASDWAALCAAHPLDVSAQMLYDWGETTGRSGAWVMPDWSRVAEHWDGVHLGTSAYLRLAGRAIDCGSDRAGVIAGWSPDTTFWLRDVVGPVGAAERWVRSEPNTHVNVHAWSRGITS